MTGTSDFISVIECVFSNTWRMVTSVEYPGTGVPIAAILVGVFLIGLVLRIVSSVLGSGGSDKE